MSNSQNVCNKVFVRSLREGKRWNQEQAAAHLDLSDRTIRRAECGLPISTATLHAIAKGYSVEPMRLLFKPLDNVRSLLDIFARNERRTMSVAADKGLISEAIQFEVAGLEHKIPIGGTFRGIEGCERFLDEYFRLFDRTQKAIEFDDPIEVQPGRSVTIKGEEHLRGRWSRSRKKSVRVTLTFTFDEHSRLVKLEDEYDMVTVMLCLGMIRHTPERFHHR